MRILIVGAGIGGLTTAIALQRLGHRPVLVERSPELHPEGAGITVQANAWRIGAMARGFRDNLLTLLPQSMRDAQIRAMWEPGLEIGQRFRDAYSSQISKS